MSGAPEDLRGTNVFWVDCRDCLANVRPYHDTIAEAAAAWNRRASSTERASPSEPEQDAEAWAKKAALDVVQRLADSEPTGTEDCARLQAFAEEHNLSAFALDGSEIERAVYNRLSDAFADGEIRLASLPSPSATAKEPGEVIRASAALVRDFLTRDAAVWKIVGEAFDRIVRAALSAPVGQPVETREGKWFFWLDGERFAAPRRMVFWNELMAWALCDPNVNLLREDAERARTGAMDEIVKGSETPIDLMGEPRFYTAPRGHY